jgi:hypothetical protein
MSTIKILVPGPSIGRNLMICSIYSHGRQQEGGKSKHLQPSPHPWSFKKSRLKKEWKLPTYQHLLS